MNRLKARIALQQEQDQTGQESFWQDLCQRLHDRQVIPIISNAVRCDQIFDIDGDQILGISAKDNAQPMGQTIEEQLADAWAEKIGYPLSANKLLARVAQFNRVKSRDDLEAKRRYLHFLKDSLLFLAEADKGLKPGIIKELRKGIGQQGLADITKELEYPKFTTDDFDSLRTLAQFNLKIYVTTSYFDFMERAIRDAGREPRTQICFWNGEPMEFVQDGHRVDPDFVPSPKEPLVYHLFGLEAYPESLVLSEDDYLDFLTKIAQDTSQKKRVIPLYLREALTQSSLLLLGYRLQDWDFRALFRGIIINTPPNKRKFSLAIQVDPAQQDRIVEPQQAKEYLEKYFEASNFSVKWGNTDSFVQAMWQAWEAWRRG
ncbi:MAG: SIR2 family protein [Anaerolineae bacterium]|nr:SIR2 family protein [Anaerolineae bacterium]